MDDRTIVNELHRGSTQSSLACKSCRRKKLKCDRFLPQCRNCQKASRECDYPAVAHKPGPRPGTHRRGGHLERRELTATNKKRHSIAHSDSQSHETPNWSDSGVHVHSSPGYVDAKTNGSQYPELSEQSNQLTPIANDSGSAFSHACKQMSISEHSCWMLIDIYLENMTAFSLFHQPTFKAKLLSIASARHVQVLLTSMFVYSMRFTNNSSNVFTKNVHPSGMLENAYSLGHECLRECTDGPPPLHLLQALILQAHTLSTFGVRGKSWRLVGLCVRLAYEMRLHELDLDFQDHEMASENPHPTEAENWVMAEEKRRAWWAIWESDTFASTIQRLPNNIDWTRNRTNLPSPDEEWFNSTPSRSCRLHVDPNRRWRDLRDSGNTSPTAWFILLNSYKWEALSATQRIAPPTNYFDREEHFKDSFSTKDYKNVFARKRELLENCVHCALMALPTSLQAGDSYLSFSRNPLPSSLRVNGSGSNSDSNAHHSHSCDTNAGIITNHYSLVQDQGRYMIQIMSQVTQLLISRKDLEGGNFVAYPADFTRPTTTTGSQSFRVPLTGHRERMRWQRCILTADKMASVVRNASPDHYKYVNPNAATALWMAAATQLAVLTYHRDEIDADLAQSNLDLLTTTIESFIAFWDVPKTLIQSLAALQGQLKNLNLNTLSTVNTTTDSNNIQHQQQASLQPSSTVQNPNLYPSSTKLLHHHSSSSTNPDAAPPPYPTHQPGLISMSAAPDTSTSSSSNNVAMQIPNTLPSSHDNPTNHNNNNNIIDISPFDVLQAMDFGAMYNGIENWENLFLDPGFPVTDMGY